MLELERPGHIEDAEQQAARGTGKDPRPARGEALVPNLPPVALVDGEALARDMVRLSMGVRGRKIVLASFDEDFFASFGA